MLVGTLWLGCSVELGHIDTHALLCLYRWGAHPPADIRHSPRLRREREKHQLTLGKMTLEPFALHPPLSLSLNLVFTREVWAAGRSKLVDATSRKLAIPMLLLFEEEDFD